MWELWLGVYGVTVEREIWNLERASVALHSANGVGFV